MIIPSANLVAEAQIAAMLPDGVSLHTTRLRLGKAEDEKLAMLERLEEAVDALADAQVDRIVFHFWRDAVLAAREESADAYLLSCTAIRSVEVIAELERELDRPVITSNGAMAWHALRHAGITDTVSGYGRLFER